MAEKLVARLRRFLHCLFHLHRAVDLYDYPKLPTRFLYGLRGRHIAMLCECSKVYWQRGSQP